MTVGRLDNGAVQEADARRQEIAESLGAVLERISRARAAAGRGDVVDLVVVTKTFPASDVETLAALGVTDVAENRDQEAREKRAQAATPAAAGLRWHMIGQLQRNKAASVARWADVVESVDRPEVAAALSRGAVSADRSIEVLVQVALDPQPQPGRGGVHPESAVDLAAGVADLPGLVLRGVMGVAPYPGDPDDAFERLARVSAAIRERWPAADRVSAGMSGDLEQAIAHGATQVRVGGAILGHRVTVQ
jgi:PLP dependent protein